MDYSQQLIESFFQEWHNYQKTLIAALSPLEAEHLERRLAPKLLSVGEIAAHIAKNRAAWFFFVMKEGGEDFETIARWDVRGEIAADAKGIIQGLETTWQGMHKSIAGWTAEDWQMTWPDEEDQSTPDILTRPWILWHMIEHDIHHGGEISIMLGSFGLQGLQMSG